jgi:hypothetical protein
LHHDGIGLAQKRGGGIDVFGRERVVRAFYDDDAILAAGLDEDWRDAAGDSFRDADVAGVDALRLEIFDGGRAEEIAADFCNHGDGRAAEPRGYSLICSFAAEAEIEFFAEDGFAGAREDVVESGEVHVGAAYNGDEGLFGHSGGLYPCPVVRVLCSVGSACLKWEVGFNTEVAEGAEKRRRAGETCYRHGAQHSLARTRDEAAPLQRIVELRLDRVCRHAYKHERANQKKKLLEPVRRTANRLSLEPLKHVHAT